MLKKFPSLLIVLAFLSLTGVANAAATGSSDPCATSTGGSSTWVAPTGAAPSNNVAAPINVSGTDQVKPGKLTVGTLPCPLPLSGVWTPTSKLTVNGVTDTAGFSNWGASYLAGKVAIGGNWTRTSTSPMLYIKSPATTTNGVYVEGGGTFIGKVGIGQIDGSTLNPDLGGNTLYVQGFPVCLKNGWGCPTSMASGSTSTTGTSASSSWTASGTNLYNTNTGTVMLGTTSNIYPSTKLFVSGTSRIGADVDYGSSPVLSVAPGTVNFDAPGSLGGRMTINGTTGNVGIHISNPLAPLHVRALTNQNLVINGNGNGTDAGATGISSINDSNTAYSPMAFGASRFNFTGGGVTVTHLHMNDGVPMYTVNRVSCGGLSQTGDSTSTVVRGTPMMGMLTSMPYCAEGALGGSGSTLYYPNTLVGYLAHP